MQVLSPLKNRILISLLWLFLTTSMAFWWLYIGIQQARQVDRLQKQAGGERIHSRSFIRYKRMFATEGVFFILLLFGGGITLIWLSYLDKKKSNILKDFFLTVSHEMKTPLASHRLQAESLEEYLTDAEGKQILQRLLEDSARLELQMDKALYLASINRSENLFLEAIDFNQLIGHISYSQSGIILSGKKDVILYGDRRALESILKNLIENAKIHGKADQVFIEILTTKKNMAIIKVEDNGQGFTGTVHLLGKAFFRHSSTSGSGIGLFLVKTLIEKMSGTSKFILQEGKLIVEFTLPLAQPS